MIVPTYNEAHRIAATLQVICAELSHDASYEVIVVDDGSTDGTWEAIHAVIAELPHVRPLRISANRGKGAAVRLGMLEARGRYRCFCDADLAIPIAQVDQLLRELRQGAEVVIASRALPSSRLIGCQGLARRGLSDVFNWVVRVGLGLPYRDTQCGFKGCSDTAARAIFSRLTIKGFAFDVELLLIARAFGYQIVEMPVEVHHSRSSTVGLVSHAGEIVRALRQMRRQRAGGFYQRDVQAAAAIEPSRQPAGCSRLSAVILTKNEAVRIQRCLDSIRWADEIIVVDGMSTDDTVAICKASGATVIQRPFSGDFGHERNVGAEAASGEWMLQLDGDDVVSEELRQALERLLREGTPHAAFQVRRKNNFLGHWMMRGGWYHYYHTLYRKSACHFEGRVHHLLKVSGTIGTLEAPVLHYPFTSLEQFVVKQNRYTSLEAQEMFETQGVLPRSLVRYQLTWRPLKLVWKSFVKKQGFREGWYGLVFALLYGWVHFLKWAKYWELVRQHYQPEPARVVEPAPIQETPVT